MSKNSLPFRYLGGYKDDSNIGHVYNLYTCRMRIMQGTFVASSVEIYPVNKEKYIKYEMFTARRMNSYGNNLLAPQKSRFYSTYLLSFPS